MTEKKEKKNVKESMELKELNATRLLGKEYSPMVIRRVGSLGFPMFVSIICDYCLNDLDDVIHDSIKTFSEEFNVDLNNPLIQDIRNLTGYLTDSLRNYYEEKKKGCMEGVAVVFYCDKMMCNSLWGDFMVHLNCKTELFQSIMIMTQI